MIWRRTSAGFDGSLNGDQRSGFRRSRVPGVEANLKTILRNSRERSVEPCYSLGNPSTISLRFTFTISGETNQYLQYYSALSQEPTTRTTHATDRSTLFHSYLQHVRPASLAPPLTTQPRLLHHLFYRPCLFAFVLLSGLIPTAFVHTSQV
jgi:hypothetical protein